MSSTLKSLRALGDPTRLRIVALLENDELSVAELQEITNLGQSRISTHLGLLQDSELLCSRREGKRTFYKINDEADAIATDFIAIAVTGAKELPEYPADQTNLRRILERRKEQAQELQSSGWPIRPQLRSGAIMAGVRPIIAPHSPAHRDR